MKKLFTTILSLIVVLAMSCTGHAEDTPKVNTIIDKAIKALGGEEKLGKINIVSWKSDTIQYIIPGHDAKWTKITVIQRPDHYRVVSESTIEGKAIKLVIILAGDKGYLQSDPLDKESISNIQQDVRRTLISMTMLALKGKEYKKEHLAETKIGDKQAVGLKVTASDKEEFEIYFDKESGLPVKLAMKIKIFTGVSTRTGDKEIYFSDYKMIAGIKKATKIVTKINTQLSEEESLTEFKILKTVDPNIFVQPE